MAKRHLGLGKAAKAKKQKTETPEVEQSNELTVELGEEIDANDAVAQVNALWNTYLESEEKKEVVLNGIIHECDRILRKVHNKKENDEVEEDGETIKLSGRFYGVYALALANLALFHTEKPEEVDAYFEEAEDRIDAGHEFQDIDLLFAKARVLITKIPLAIVSRLDISSKTKKSGDVGVLLDECLACYEEAEKKTQETGEYTHYNAENLDFLGALDDLLDMIDHFGGQNMEGDDSDNEEEDDVELAETHPLYSIKSSDKYNSWWRDHTLVFLKNLDKQIETSSTDKLAALRRELCKRLGQSYLMEAEVPSNVYTTLTYYSKAESMNGLSKTEAQKLGQELFSTALKYLKDAQDEEEPETWVNVAEAMISLGNTYELDSEEQENAYKEAEEILVRANNATNGKFDDILQNLKGDLE